LLLEIVTMSCATSALMPASAGSHVRSILVVDDEEPIRMVLTGFFEDSGYHVVEACDVAEAKGILADRPVDLVFSDINMPGRETGFVLEKWFSRTLRGLNRVCTDIWLGPPICPFWREHEQLLAHSRLPR
jgi:hypothetical protein